MSNTTVPEDELRRVGKGSVNKALDVLRSKVISRKRKTDNHNKETLNSKIESYCISTISDRRKKRKSPATIFNRSTAFLEMRSCLAHHDWRHLQELFHITLDAPLEYEPNKWRYALILLMCSPDSSTSNLREFFELCLGNQAFEETNFLERIFSTKPSVEIDESIKYSFSR
ncbi:uncharacterized protein LOC107270580 [Cephus cinctus]|uniref:Uncharacterized protein LOC107270580 n=1 Tax=Cephus cinctus TaxID=211228 RepID=A0AAJ7C3W3_CEPCN|nr:uncharacterized protein LOC107270580 [Cephus cinctus]